MISNTIEGKIIFDNSYFEDEVIGGFYVPSLMKRCWAVQMEVLFQFTKICKKHNIQYFAEWGTLISAVRHGDMIPWDDDMDVTMKRWEYEKFRKYAKEELPEGYFFTDFETTRSCWQFIVNLTASERMDFTKDYMDIHHGFPYRAGLDIFILDNYPDVEEDAHKQSEDIKNILSTADLIFNKHISGDNIEKSLLNLEIKTGINLDCIKKILNKGYSNNEERLYDIRLELYKIAREICGKYNDRDTKRIAQMMPWGIFEHRSMPQEFFKDAIYKKYGPTEISLPLYSHELLSRKFGTYYIPYKSGAGHDYPYYENQRKLLGEDIDFVKNYKPEKIGLKIEKRLSPIKRIARDYIDYIKNNYKNYNGCQNITIEFGEYLERVKGRDFILIRDLEQYCEDIYETSLGTKSATDYSMAIDILIKRIENIILNHNIYVFITYKAKYFRVFSSIYSELVTDFDNEIYVIPQPLYYKTYDGSRICDYTEEDSYPKGIKVAHGVDIETLSPDVIYIQNPYDNYNMAVDTKEEFYSDYLKECCGELVYIPYFKEFDFAKSDERQYYNMKYYCLMPGVINADKIILPSQALKDVYIEKLTEEYGQEVRTIFDEKICIDQNNLFKDDSRDKARDILKEQIDISKKIVIFYTDISLLYQYKDQAIKKIQSVIDEFKEQKTEISLIWSIDSAIENELPDIDKGLYEAFAIVKEGFESDEIGYINKWNLNLIADACDAYYGDPSPLMQKILDKEKPIMLCNYRA